VNLADDDRVGKGMWIFLAALVGLQIYFVRELLAALFLFTVGFAILAGLALVLFLAEQAGQLSVAWVEPRARVVAGFARRGLELLEDLSRKPFHRPRSEPGR
jgi:hypothetical protein